MDGFGFVAVLRQRRLLPALLLLSIGAAIVYFGHGDAKGGLSWLARGWEALSFAPLRGLLAAVPMAWVFPGLLILLNLGAAIVCFANHDWKRGAYWMSSAVCLAMVAL